MTIRDKLTALVGHGFPLALLMGVLILPPTSAHADIIHRYSFNNPAGDASNATIVDSVGGADGMVLGAGATFDGTQLSLPGGDMTVAAYVDLPNGIVSSLTDVTFEGWSTLTGNPSWTRLFDFGSSVGGEVLSPGGGGEGLDYIALTASRGTVNDQQRAEIRNIDPIGGGPAITSTSDSNEVTPNGVLFHWALVYDADGSAPGTASFVTYRNGVRVATGATAIQLANLNDVNNWLGRSNWTNDGNLAGTYEEFRMYDTAFNDQLMMASFMTGPDEVFEVDVPGDFNGDLVIDIMDFDILAGNFRMTGALYEDGDMNFDGIVDLHDFGEWRAAFDAAGGAAVPEVATGLGLLLGLAAVGLMRRPLRS